MKGLGNYISQAFHYVLASYCCDYLAPCGREEIS